MISTDIFRDLRDTVAAGDEPLATMAPVGLVETAGPPTEIGAAENAEERSGTNLRTVRGAILAAVPGLGLTSSDTRQRRASTATPATASSRLLSAGSAKTAAPKSPVPTTKSDRNDGLVEPCMTAAMSVDVTVQPEKVG